LKGLVRLTEWVQGMGQGYTLTQAGLDLLENGLRPGAPLPSAPPPVFGPDAETEEEPLRTPLLRQGRPAVTWTLIGLNLLVFVAGVALTVHKGAPAIAFINGDQAREPVVRLVLYQLGSLSGKDVLQDREWWRVITYAFLHLGILHIALN